MNPLKRRLGISYLMAAGATILINCAIADSALAQTAWTPDRPVKIVVPWPPGGGSDTTARIAAQVMQNRLGQPVVIENRPGATGAIGSEQVYKASPDGYTLLLATMDSQAINPHFNTLSFDTKSFTPVSGLAKTGLVLLGRPDLQASNFEELKALSKKEKLSYASPGVGSSMHVLSDFLGSLMQMEDFLHVPYQGLGPAVQAVASNEADLVIVPTVVATQWKDKLKIYAVTSEKRLSQLPDTPTLSEMGVPLVSDSWLSLVGPPDMPKSVVTSLNAAAQDAIEDSATREKMISMGLLPHVGSADDFAVFFIGEYDRWGKVISDSKK